VNRPNDAVSRPLRPRCVRLRPRPCRRPRASARAPLAPRTTPSLPPPTARPISRLWAPPARPERRREPPWSLPVRAAGTPTVPPPPDLRARAAGAPHNALAPAAHGASDPRAFELRARRRRRPPRARQRSRAGDRGRRRGVRRRTPGDARQVLLPGRPGATRGPRCVLQPATRDGRPTAVAPSSPRALGPEGATPHPPHGGAHAFSPWSCSVPTLLPPLIRRPRSGVLNAATAGPLGAGSLRPPKELPRAPASSTRALASSAPSGRICCAPVRPHRAPHGPRAAAHGTAPYRARTAAPTPLPLRRRDKGAPVVARAPTTRRPSPPASGVTRPLQRPRLGCARAGRSPASEAALT
jgi:hypothetical protein